jgi:putative acetyltransferase
VTVRRGSSADVPRVLEIWRDAVDATHGFLSPADRAEIDAMVVEWLPTVDLWMIDDGACPVGFLVMDGNLIDALFVDPALHGRGFGTALLRHALALAPEAEVDASEQATNALPFYESRGFVRTGRSETDAQGRPYPLIHLKFVGVRAPSASLRSALPP